MEHISTVATQGGLSVTTSFADSNNYNTHSHADILSL